MTIRRQHCLRLPRKSEHRRLKRRIAAVPLAIACLAALILLSTIEPARAGYGSHLQLGLEPCGWTESFNIPCPTCGVTTAASLAARGNLVSAFNTQPFGTFLTLGIAILFWLQVGTAFLGWAGPDWSRILLSRRPWLVLLSLLVIGWTWKLITWT
ncbi:MAG: DUF2752 domain-containing protein [Phycisphaeraceae bacterium]